MQLRAALLLFASAFLVSTRPLAAQDPGLAPDNLKFTRKVIEQQHLIVDCSLEVLEGSFVKFRYDHYPDLERITQPDAVYARPKGKPWLKSDDWGETGSTVDAAKAAELDHMIAIANAPFQEPDPHDPDQGGIVWRAVTHAGGKDFQTYTYERSREKPKADGVYPTYTFIQYKGDKDGRFLLTDFTAQMKDSTHLIPVTIHYDYMILLPAGSVKVVTPTPKGMDGKK